MAPANMTTTEARTAVRGWKYASFGKAFFALPEIDGTFPAIKHVFTIFSVAHNMFWVAGKNLLDPANVKFLA